MLFMRELNKKVLKFSFRNKKSRLKNQKPRNKTSVKCKQKTEIIGKELEER